jgi:CheY-like chemotaxis protein
MCVAGAPCATTIPVRGRFVTSADTPAAPRALVVDDEDLVRDVARMTLEAVGFEVCSAADGESALRHLRDEGVPFAVMVLDVSLQGMGGPEVLARARTIRPGLPVLLVSGFDRATALARLDPEVSAEPFAFLEKPFRPTHLQRAVAALLDASRR